MNKTFGKIKILLCLLFFISVNSLEAQKIKNTVFIEEIIENLLQNNEAEEYDFDTYFEIFTYYADRPININKATRTELEELHILSEVQLTELFRYLESERRFISKFELQAVPSIDLNTIYNLLPFIKISGEIEDFHVPMKKLLFQGTHQIFLRYSQQFPLKEGYKKDESSNARFLGDPTKLYFRYKYNFSNKISYGITAEKDAGEEFFTGNNKKGFDFYSGHIFFKTNSVFKKVALGDYRLKLGQGLLAWTGFGTGKSSFTMMVKKTGSELKPYTSVDEYRFMRGAATQIELNDFTITPFVSVKQVDANVSFADSAELEIETLSLQTFGLHRSNSEIEDKDQLLEIKAGSAFKYSKNDRSIGLNIIHTEFDKEVVSAEKAYNKFRRVGKRFTNASVDYNYLVGTFHFFGENALSFTQNENNKFGYGLLNGVLFSADKHVDISLVHRYFDKKFVTSIATDVFAESTTPNNEHGLYIGTEIRPLKYIRLNAYFDIYQFPWLRFQTSTPSIGRDILAQATYKPSRTFEMYFRYKNERKQQNTKIDLEDDYTLVTKQNKNYFTDYFGESILFEKDDLGNEILKANSTVSKDALSNAKFIAYNTLQTFRLNVRYKVTKTWSFQSRVDATIFNDEINGVKYGFMAFQDVAFKPLSFPVSFNLRLAYFDVQDYGARIYTYENDVLYQFSIPAFNNRGFRTYLNVRYRIIKGIDFWLKISNTHYTNINEISSGSNAALGNNLTELKAQLRFKF
ncbi:MAG: ComEA family DNA-binding protein [Chitinophagales bacterium]